MPTAKVTLTLDEPLLSEARQRVGRRGLSGYMNRALRHQLQRDRLIELLEQLEAEGGSVEARTMEEVRQEWPEAKEAKNPRRARSA